MAWLKSRKAIACGIVVLLGLIVTVLFLAWPKIANQMMIAAGKRAIAEHIATPIDLTSYYGAPAAHLEKSSSFWGQVPWEFQVFHHVPLQIDGMLCLWGAGNARKGAVFPDKVLGIVVNQTFQTLYVYHCTFFGSTPNTPVYDLVFRYEDGDSATNTVRYDIDVLDFNTAKAKKIKGPTGQNSKLAWSGHSSMQYGKMRFCLTAIQNPRPNVEVTSIDLFSSKNQSAGVIFAMTAGPSGLMK
jgi:hypothetical protein